MTSLEVFLPDLLVVLEGGSIITDFEQEITQQPVKGSNRVSNIIEFRLGLLPHLNGLIIIPLVCMVAAQQKQRIGVFTQVT